MTDRMESALANVPQFKRGMVWCTKCDASQPVDAVKSVLWGGWPECCGYTMTIDSPEEQRVLKGQTDG